MNKIVWQPFGIYQPLHDFGILLDKPFTLLMSKSSIEKTKVEGLDRMGFEFLERFGYSNKHPFMFYENSALVEQFSLGSNGRWLSLEGKPVDDPRKKMFKYHSHNIDSPSDVEALLGLVDIWTEYSDILIE